VEMMMECTWRQKKKKNHVEGTWRGDKETRKEKKRIDKKRKKFIKYIIIFSPP